MYRYALVAVISLAVGFSTGWKTQGWRLGKEIATIRVDSAKQAEGQGRVARAKEADYVGKLAKAQESRNVEVARINRKHADTVASLRQRPERLATFASEVPSAPAACTGSTGAELARGDAEFLAGYAADAAKLEAALNQCEAAYNALRD